MIVHVYDVWSREISYPLMAEVPLPWGYRNHLDPLVPMGLWRTLHIAEFRYLPLYSRQESLLLLLRGRDSSERPRITDAGFMEVTRANPRSVDRDAQEHLDFTGSHRFSMSADNRRALDTLSALAARYRFPVFLANSPLYAGVYQDPMFRAYYDAVGQSLQAWCDANPRLHYLFREPMRFPRDMMENVDHLTKAGALRYSHALAARIATELGARRQ